jgi:hypothetical protein
MGSALSSMWFFVSPIPDVSSKGKPKPISAALMLCSCIILTIALYMLTGYIYALFPIPPCRLHFIQPAVCTFMLSILFRVVNSLDRRVNLLKYNVSYLSFNI